MQWDGLQVEADPTRVAALQVQPVGPRTIQADPSAQHLPRWPAGRTPGSRGHDWPRAPTHATARTPVLLRIGCPPNSGKTHGASGSTWESRTSRGRGARQRHARHRVVASAQTGVDLAEASGKLRKRQRGQASINLAIRRPCSARVITGRLGFAIRVGGAPSGDGKKLPSQGPFDGWTLLLVLASRVTSAEIERAIESELCTTAICVPP